MTRSERRIVAGSVIIASTTQLQQTWGKHRPKPLPDGWQVWWLSAEHGLRSSSEDPDGHPLQRSQVVQLAERVTRQWNGNIATSIVMVGSWKLARSCHTRPT